MKVKDTGATIIAYPSGRLDLAGAQEMELELDQIAEKHGDKNLLLNLQGVDYLSSSGVSALLRLRRKFEQSNRWMRLSSLSTAATKIMDTLNMSHFFEIRDTEEDALK